VVTDGKGDYLLAFKGHEDEDNAGVSTRAYGDHFTATAQIVDGALIQCLPITEVARMVTNLVNGVSGLHMYKLSIFILVLLKRPPSSQILFSGTNNARRVGRDP
jgi:hypothetical protein